MIVKAVQGKLFQMDAYRDELEGGWDLKMSNRPRAEVKRPGARGGKYHRTKTGHIKYGKEPGTKQFHDKTIELLQALYTKTGATAIPRIIENVKGGKWSPRGALEYIQSSLPPEMQGLIDKLLPLAPEGDRGARQSPAEAKTEALESVRRHAQEAQGEGPSEWGKPYGMWYNTPEGAVRMQRKGQRVRFYTSGGRHVGPEQPSVAGAAGYAETAGWAMREEGGKGKADAWAAAGRVKRAEHLTPRESGEEYKAAGKRVIAERRTERETDDGGGFRDKKTGEEIKPFGYRLDAQGRPARGKPDMSPGDYGADPMPNGQFRMVPSGKVVSAEEKNEILSKRKNG